jgi:hypothetical protein
MLPDIPPFSFLNDEGPVGYSVDLIIYRRVCQLTRISFIAYAQKTSERFVTSACVPIQFGFVECSAESSAHPPPMLLFMYNSTFSTS